MNPNSKRRSDGTSKINWRTPPWLWEKLQTTFNFEVDGASDGTDNLLPLFHTCSTQSDRYSDYRKMRIFINPPFNELSNNFWLNDIYYLTKNKECKFTCFLIPFAPETHHWHAWIWPYVPIFVFNKRINYIDPSNVQEKKGVAFPSCLAIYTCEKIDTNWLEGDGLWIKRI